MPDKIPALILLVACLGLVHSLSSQRAALKLKQDNYRGGDGLYKYGKTDIKENEVNKNEESGVLDNSINSKLSLDNVYFTAIKTHIDERFKQFEDEITNKVNTLITNIISEDDKNNNDVVDKERENVLLTGKNNRYIDLMMQKQYNSDNKNLYDEAFNRAIQSANYISSDDNEGSKYTGNEANEARDKNFNMYEDKNRGVDENKDFNDYLNDESEEYEDNLVPFDRNNEDRKDEEFGVFDYLAASKDSGENKMKIIGEVKDDGEFIPDDYFDNSDYEA